jgi:7,8-dihydropterin-6-yl-methyl-4-(beta-D-ribofuranosyl)aminobenzene 5'-phosphate synthase
MKITVLVENSEAPDREELLFEHGLSIHIEFQGNNILFDTGASEAFSKNADALGIDLSAVDSAVLSHHHYDHGGGLARFIELNRSAKIYLNEAPDGELYFKALGFMKRYIGLDPKVFDTNSERFEVVDRNIEILPDVHIIPNIELPYQKPAGNKYLFLNKGPEWHLDEFLHELILVINEKDGLVVFSGCSHNGIPNIIDTVNTQFGGMPIKAVIGGFHLIGLPMFNTMAGSKREVEDVARKTLTYPVAKVYSGHCTGQKAYQVLKDVMGDKLDQLHTGAVIVP